MWKEHFACRKTWQGIVGYYQASRILIFLMHEPRSAKGTCQYPLAGLILWQCALPTQSTKSSILGSGKESGLITALILPLSVQNILVESDSGTKIHGELHRLWLGTARLVSQYHIFGGIYTVRMLLNWLAVTYINIMTYYCSLWWYISKKLGIFTRIVMRPLAHETRWDEIYTQYFFFKSAMMKFLWLEK